MLGKPLLSFPPLEEGILLKRYKRFLADIKLSNGEIVTAHCANTGPMTGVLHQGGRELEWRVRKRGGAEAEKEEVGPEEAEEAEGVLVEGEVSTVALGG